MTIADYLPFQSDVARNVMEAFDAAGINIHLPQQECVCSGNAPCSLNDRRVLAT